MMAVKDGPSQQSNKIAQVTREHDYVASGRSGDFLQITLKLEDSSVMTGYVLHVLNDQALLRPAEQQQHHRLTPASPGCSQSTPQSRPHTAQATLDTDATNGTMAEKVVQAVEAGH